MMKNMQKCRDESDIFCICCGMIVTYRNITLLYGVV